MFCSTLHFNFAVKQNTLTIALVQCARDVGDCYSCKYFPYSVYSFLSFVACCTISKLHILFFEMFLDIANNSLAHNDYSNGFGCGGGGRGFFGFLCFFLRITTIISESNIFIPIEKH